MRAGFSRNSRIGGAQNVKPPSPSVTTHSPSHRELSRAWICTYATAAIVGAVLASSVLVTADAASVYEGASLPQVLVLLVGGVVASFSKISPFPQRAGLPLVLTTLLLGWLFLSTTSATWLANGRAAFNGFWHVSALIVCGFLLRQLCRWPEVARSTAQLLVVGAIMLSVHAVHQYVISMPEARARYAENPDRELAELGLDAPPGSAMRMQFESRLSSTEPLATFALTNSLAVVLSAVVVFQGILIADQLRRRPLNYWALGANLLAGLLIGTACLLTKSRTAVLAVAVIVVWVGAVLWRLRKATKADPLAVRQTLWSIAVGAAVSIGLFAALVALLSRDTLILSEAPKSLAFRLEYWQATSKMILDFPLTGVGLGNFQSYYPRYKLETASETIADPHNWLFDIAACCSLPVLSLVLISLVMMVTRNFALLRQHLQPTAAAEERDAPHLHNLDNDELSHHQPALVKALWIGAAMGWLLTATMQWILQEAIDIEAAALGLVVSLAALGVMRRAAGPSEAAVRGAALAAAMTMLLCLLASGSWQASGIALPLVAWLAVSSFGSDAPPLLDGSRRSSIEARFHWQAAATGLLLIGFLFQTWRPVNSSWTHQQQAWVALQRGDMEAAQQSAKESRAADPINPDTYRLVVQTLVFQAESVSPERLDTVCDQAEQAIAAMLACDPVSNVHWKFAAESAMTLAATAQSRSPAAASLEAAAVAPGGIATNWTPLARRMLERAAEYGAGATERYPSSAALHAQLGVILALLDKHAEAHAEFDRAFALSDATPHLDRKLKRQQIWLPAPLAPFPSETIQRPARGSNWVAAEPLCRFLRTKH